MASNPLVQLSKLGQSPWYDQMTRSLVSEGTLKNMIEEDGLRGLTSNPTIFEKAISGSKDYEDALRELAGKSVDEIYDALVVVDIANAADVFRPVYEKEDGKDGFVSIEVSPLLAHDTAGTVKEARRLHAKLARPNVMIKVPATPEGLPAFEELISEGVSVNVTLIFRWRFIAKWSKPICGVWKSESPRAVRSTAWLPWLAFSSAALIRRWTKSWKRSRRPVARKPQSWRARPR